MNVKYFKDYTFNDIQWDRDKIELKFKQTIIKRIDPKVYWVVWKVSYFNVKVAALGIGTNECSCVSKIHLYYATLGEACRVQGDCVENLKNIKKKCPASLKSFQTTHTCQCNQVMDMESCQTYVLKLNH